MNSNSTVMQFYGEKYTEIEGFTLEITSLYIKVAFDHQKDVCYVPKKILEESFNPQLLKTQKYNLPTSFLKRIRAIPLYDPSQM